MHQCDAWTIRSRIQTAIDIECIVVCMMHMFQGHDGQGEVLIRGEQIVRHGQGRHDCANGDYYEGGWQFDKREGVGELHLASGTVMHYRGGWKDDKTEGFGSCTYRNGSKYEGEFRDDVRCGRGVMHCLNGEHYEGEWKDDVMHGVPRQQDVESYRLWMTGSGRWTVKERLHYYEGQFVNGEIVHGKHIDSEKDMEYHGSFLNGLAHGEGSLSLKNEWKYVGMFERGQQSGDGMCRWKSGDRYEGLWKDGVRHGAGKQFFRDACIYDGLWCKDEKHGKGFWVLPNGDRYNGDFEYDQMEGEGMMMYLNGDKYKGHWKKSKRHGYGTSVYADGHVYKGKFVDATIHAVLKQCLGEWTEDRREGYGKCRFSDGTKFCGQWKNDAWIQSAASPEHCIVSGDGANRAIAGKEAIFQIEARDEFDQRRLSGGDVFHIVMRDAKENTFYGTVKDHENGVYTASYTINISGDYELYILLEDRECLAASPYPLHVFPDKPCVKTSCIDANQLLRGPLPLHQEHEFFVSPRDVYGNPCLYPDVQEQFPVEVQLEGQCGECHVQVNLGIDGQYHCSFQPSIDGFYRLFVTVNKQHLPGSPFSIQVGKVDPDIQHRPRDESAKWKRVLEEAIEDEEEEKQATESTESKFIKDHPDIPVITNLEDIWKLSKLQKERQRRTAAQR